MIVVGGTYQEYCVYPNWNEYYGSGGRAAAALALAGVKPFFITCADDRAADVVEARGRAIGYECDITPVDETPIFSYWTPLHEPSVSSWPDHVVELPAKDDVVLRFGMLEAQAIVHAKRAVYDPQSEGSAESFDFNGSEADQYSIVLNETEVRRMGDSDDVDSAARNILAKGASVVFVKRGPFGVLVYWSGVVETVPAFRTTRAFTIGSGDVFSAAIALHWGISGRSPVDAAFLASQAVAEYAESRRLVLNATALASRTREPANARAAHVYIAAPFFTLSQRRAVEELRDQLISLGMSPISPLHDVGLGGEALEIANKDLELIKGSDLVLALLDGRDLGTVFEVGYARAKDKPVIIFVSEPFDKTDETMIVGTNCAVYNDYVAALYATTWANA